MFNWVKNKTAEIKADYQEAKSSIDPKWYKMLPYSRYGIRVMRIDLVMYRWPMTNMKNAFIKEIRECRFCWAGKTTLRKDAGWVHIPDVTEFADIADQ